MIVWMLRGRNKREKRKIFKRLALTFSSKAQGRREGMLHMPTFSLMKKWRALSFPWVTESRWGTMEDDRKSRVRIDSPAPIKSEGGGGRERESKSKRERMCASILSFGSLSLFICQIFIPHLSVHTCIHTVKIDQKWKPILKSINKPNSLFYQNKINYKTANSPNDTKPLKASRI